MTGEERVPEVDRAVLEAIQDRLRTAPQIETAEIVIADGQTELKAPLTAAATPTRIDRRFLDIRWYTNGDFRIHYQEDWPDRTWSQRWDRHPNEHNDRDHFHPPPDAATPGENRTWSSKFEAVLKLVVNGVRTRTDSLWQAVGDGE
ncbi:hypothetical protein [Halonotius roseus]|uniref:Uncharacterized protein n=1 Tax=Halonotius roseus TaxID=2511997 RepID=A0A544QPD0_9EURY|nr:hypothetical protein [Halonotius roseus]TQQ80766.1 hypothetical protein EWF95_09830 [Halonotius roseus]